MKNGAADLCAGSPFPCMQQMKAKIDMEQSVSARPELQPFLDAAICLTALPAKNKKRLLALYYLAEKIDGEGDYTEMEINDLLNAWTAFHDPATLRRELYNKRLLNRTKDCSRYWKSENVPPVEAFLAENI